MSKVVQVHNYEDAIHALENAGGAVTLQNADGTAKYQGFLYIKAMFEKALKKFPKVRAKVVFDAGDDAATAVVAMTNGFKYVRFGGSEVMRAKLKNIASQMKAEIL